MGRDVRIDFRKLNSIAFHTNRSSVTFDKHVVLTFQYMLNM